MEKHNLNSLNPAKFADLIKNREIEIALASSKEPKLDFNANRIAKAFHPAKQHLIVSDIAKGKNTNVYKLIPNGDKGTHACAYFSAGQYITVYAEIGGKTYSRPYSLVSSPKDALNGFYTLAIKAVDGGLVSNYILENWSVGTEIKVSDPIGNFTFEPLRDAHNIVAVAGGSGITPFVSMAKSVAEGDEDFNLTLLYGSRKEEDILFKAELDALAQKCEKIKVVYVLSDENNPQFEHGNISLEIIEKYAPEGKYSIFLCGPEAMTRFVDKEIEKLDLERKYIRHEVHGEAINPSVFEDYPNNAPELVTVTVWIKGEKKVITSSPKSTLVRILEDNGITPPTRCRSGECGFCHSRLISGEVFIPKELNKLRQADSKFGFIHPCCSYPLTDIEIEISEN